jgi:subtilisin family serine protease
MKRPVIFLILLTTVLLSVVSLSAVSAQSSTREYIVMAAGETSVSSAIKSQIASAGGTITRDLSSMGMLVVSSSNPNFKSRIPSARAVVPNVKVQWVYPTEVVALDVDPNVIPNPPNTGDDDEFLDLQWGHDAVNAFQAWADPEPGRGAGVRVAVIDSGIDRNHPDIAPNLNQALSTSFVPGESVFVVPNANFNHGTHVAGTIGAADNGFGVVGVAPEVELVAIKGLSEFTGSGEWDWLVAAIKYAGDIRADVINMSLGGVLDVRGSCEDPSDCYTAQDVVDLRNALARAVRYANRRGATVIASAGNDAIEFDSWDNRYLVDFPASVPGVVVISAMAPIGWAVDPANADFDIPTSYTNSGREFVDFGAPGGDSMYPGNENCTVATLVRPCWVFDLVFSVGRVYVDATGVTRVGFFWAGGTSMAAPHASGVAAIIIGWNGGSMRPDLVFSEMRRLARNVGSSTTAYFGHGIVSAEWRDG